MTLALPQKKKEQTDQCQPLLKKSTVSIRELTKLIGQLASTTNSSSASTTAISGNTEVANYGTRHDSEKFRFSQISF